MSSDNLELWRRVEKTNPAHTKSVNFGRKITAIDPYQQIRSATEQFGSAGNGWGWEVVNVQHLSTNEVCVLIRLWHGSDKTKFIEQWGQCSLFIDKAEKKKDTDCMKKATTDGITKCLSYLGFNSDIFLGKFDDNKYVQERKNEENVKTIAAREKHTPTTTNVEENTNDLIAEAIKAINEAATTEQIKAIYASYPSIQKSLTVAATERNEQLKTK